MLELSPNATGDELGLMIEGKLSQREMDEEPANVQVVCSGEECDKVWLKDNLGTFLEAPEPQSTTEIIGHEGEMGKEESIIATKSTVTLDEALEANTVLKEKVRSLLEEVSRLQEELESCPSVETVEHLHRDLRREKDRVKSKL